MRTLEDPEEHFSRYIEQASERYWDGLHRAGLEPNETLTRAVAERALEEAKASYLQHAAETRDHNIEVILKEHDQRLREIKREGARLGFWICLPLAAGLGVWAWYNVCYRHDWIIGIVFSIAALACLVMLVFADF